MEFNFWRIWMRPSSWFLRPEVVRSRLDRTRTFEVEDMDYEESREVELHLARHNYFDI